MVYTISHSQVMGMTAVRLAKARAANQSVRWPGILPAIRSIAVQRNLPRSRVLKLLMVRRRTCAISNHEATVRAASFETRRKRRSSEPVKKTDLILRSLPPGPREARPDAKLRKRLEGRTQRMDSRPSFETRARARSSG